MTREDWIARWHAATKEREKAEIESQIWQSTSNEERVAAKNSETLLGRLLNEGLTDFRCRSNLRLAGPAANALWARIDGEERLVMNAARMVLKRARLRSDAEDVGLAEAIVRELADFDTWRPFRTPDGRLFRRQPQRSRRGLRTKVSPGPARERWQTVRAAVWRCVDAELEGFADKRAREALRAQMEADISAVLDMLAARVRMIRDAGPAPTFEATKAARTGRTALKGACELLRVDPPMSGVLVDSLTLARAKKTFRALVHEYHPDVSGTEETRPRYQAVVEAYTLLEANTRQTTK